MNLDSPSPPKKVTKDYPNSLPTRKWDPNNPTEADKRLSKALRIRKKPYPKLGEGKEDEYWQAMDDKLWSEFYLERRDREWAKKTEEALEADFAEKFNEETSIIIRDKAFELFDTLNATETLENKGIFISNLKVEVKDLKCKTTTCSYIYDFGLGDSELETKFTAVLIGVAQKTFDSTYGKEHGIRSVRTPTSPNVIYIRGHEDKQW